MLFTIHGKEIRSLEELRTDFDLEEVLGAFWDGRLERWLSDCYYERQADELRVLKSEAGRPTNQPEHAENDPFAAISAIMRGNKMAADDQSDEKTSALQRKIALRLCAILGVDYVKYLPDDERPDYERKIAALQQYTDASEILARALETATDQTELAQLLNEGCRQVVLCGGSFTVPIRVGGVHYTGVGNPHMEAPYTEEQYRRAGITFENVALPKECTGRDADTARAAAEKYGFDDFYENHTALATLIHEKLKRGRLFRRVRLDDGGVSCETYRHKYEGENDVKRIVNAAYDQASEVFEPGKPECIADFAAREYAEYLSSKMKPILDKLPEDAALDALTDQAEKRLQERFERELRENADYYRMYQRSYFLEKPEIEDLMDDVEVSDNPLLNGFCKMLQREDDYMISGLLETIRELEDDVDSRSDSFFSCAEGIYREYCAELEAAAEKLGKTLTDAELGRVGLEPI